MLPTVGPPRTRDGIVAALDRLHRESTAYWSAFSDGGGSPLPPRPPSPDNGRGGGWRAQDRARMPRRSVNERSE